jgi:hypothetical protein
VGDVEALKSIALEVLEQACPDEGRDQAFRPFVLKLKAFIEPFQVQEIEQWVSARSKPLGDKTDRRTNCPLIRLSNRRLIGVCVLY